VRRLSGGQQRRLDVAVGLVGNPELLFLDEPTTGFDPSARRNAWDMIENLQALGKTVFLTTHYMDEAQHLADRVAIIARGRLVADGPPESLIEGQHALTSIRFRAPGHLDGWPEGAPQGARSEDGTVSLETGEPTRVLFALTRWAVDSGVELGELTVSRPSLEDVYLRLVGEHSEAGRLAGVARDAGEASPAR
jgi:ABC-2 type transport system ATP-binding protein